MDKPLLLAEAPGRAGADEGPLAGLPGDRLAAFAEFDGGWQRLYELFEVRNLLDEWPGPQPSGKGSRWPLAEARRAADRFPLGGVCVLLGRRVAAAYRITTPWGVWTHQPGRLVCVIPHPSGVNTLYNDSVMRHLAGEVLIDALRLARRVRAA